MNTLIADVVAAALVKQPWFIRRKDTILAVVGGLLQLAQFTTVYATAAPEWVALVIGAVIMVAQAVLHASTPGAFTPSMRTRLQQVADTMPGAPDVGVVDSRKLLAQ